MAANELQIPNPLDRLFFVFDRAAARLALPGAFIHMHLEVNGRVDAEGLKRAMACLHRIYPVTAGKLEWSGFVGRPRWRLGVWQPDLDRVVRVHHLSPPTEIELKRQVENLMAHRIELVSMPPLQIHVLRGLADGDWVVIRWPHALMDARGGFIVMETIDRLYREAADPAALSSAGDELLDGFSELPPKGDRPDRLAQPKQQPPAATGEDLQLPACPDFRDLGPLRFTVRRLTEADCQRAQEISARTCAPARFGAFLRACAIRALHHILTRQPLGRHGYSVPYLLEGRRPPHRSPVCRNLFTASRVFVPAAIAPDRPEVARCLHEATARMVAAGGDPSRLRRSLAITALPTALLAHVVRHSLIHEPAPWQRSEFARPPSLPLGFMQAFGQERRSFCGAEIRYVHAFRPPLPRQGIGVQVMAEQGRLAICGLSYQVRWEMMNRFLDDFVDALLSPD